MVAELISPMPPVADLQMAWDQQQHDPVFAIAEARARHGDTFAVRSGGETYLFTFSPVGVRSFYDVPEQVASKGLADFKMIARKLPEELFAGRRTFPHELFGRDDVASYLDQLDRALAVQLAELGASGSFEVFDFTRRLGHRLGLACWAGAACADGERFERLVEALDALDGSESFVHPERMAEIAANGKATERAALTVAESVIAETLASVAGEPPGLFGRITQRWHDVGEPDGSIGIARDVVLVHIASMSNLFAALGWTIVHLLAHPDLAEQVRSGDRALAERCALESTRVAQRSIMLRYVLAPVSIDDGHATYQVSPGAHLATLLPLLNTTAGPGLDSYDPSRWRGRRLADASGLAAVELVTAFGHGKHTCPAQPFSLAAMTRSVTALWQHFELKPEFTDPTPLRSQIGGVARSQESCLVSYRRRS